MVRFYFIARQFSVNVEGADIKKELTADLVGDYLFTDKDFINHLMGDRTLFQKVYDEIKYLCKVATGKELTEIEKVKREFDKVWKTFSTENKTVDEETKTDKVNYSISETTDGRIVAVVDNDILSNIDTTSWDNTKKETAKKAAYDALKQFSDGIVVDGVTRKVNIRSRKEYTRSEYTETLYRDTPEIFADKMRAADIADDIVVATTNWKRDGGLKHSRDDNFVDFDHGTTLIMSGDAKYSAEVVVGITQEGEAVLYDVVDMIPTTFDIKKAETSTTATTQDAIGSIQEISADSIISQNGTNVNTQFSLSYEGEQLAPIGNYSTPLNETALEQDIAPVAENATTNKTVDDIAPVNGNNADIVKSKTLSYSKEVKAVNSNDNTAPNVETKPRIRQADNKNAAPDGMGERSWYGTSTESEAVDGIVTLDDIPDDVRYYQVKSNKNSLETANARLQIKHYGNPQKTIYL